MGQPRLTRLPSSNIQPSKPASRSGQRLTRAARLPQTMLQIVRRMPFVPSPGRYDLTISHRRRFVWFRVAKVGSRSIVNHLRRHVPDLTFDDDRLLHYPLNRYRDYFKFGFVRDPYDRVVSCWQNKVVRKNHFGFDAERHEAMQRFERFVDFVTDQDLTRCDQHLRLQCKLIDLDEADFVGRLETFGDDFPSVCRRVGIPDELCKSRNVSKTTRPHAEWYSEATKRRIFEAYGLDFQIFGYPE